MSQKKEHNSGSKAAIPNLSELFGDAVKLDVTTLDVFGGDLSEIRQEERYRSEVSDLVPAAAYRKGSGSFTLTQFVLIVNLVVLTGILVYLVFRPAGITGVSAGTLTQTQSSEPAPPVLPQVEDAADPATLLHRIDLGRHTAEALDEAVSLQTAEAFYAAKDYHKAAYVYERLRRNLTTRTPENEALADWLTLQMALSLQKSQEQAVIAELFDRALNSRWPAVRALTHYNLAYIQAHNCSFAEARRHAFTAMALLKTIEDQLPLIVEADCYFLAAEALTRDLLRANNLDADLPGVLWSDSQPVHTFAVTDQAQLIAILTAGIEPLSQSVVSPKIEFDPSRSIGLRWSAYAMDAPLEQLFQQYAAQAEINLILSDLPASVRQQRTTLFLPQVERNYLAEVAAGAAGLFWRFDGATAQLYDPAEFADSDSLNAMMTQEAIAVWQRFMLRYRGDHRTPNAHYCLGRLYTLSEQAPTAMGEYKLLATQYANNPLAPYALLGSSRIKTELRDYTGAQADLNELLIRYPNAKILDEALLALAEATMNNGGYSEAAEMFQRVYYLNVSQAARRRSAFGLGTCVFRQGQADKAVTWLTQTLELMTDLNDSRLPETCYMLGQAYIETGRFVEAAETLRMALGAKLSNRDYVRIILELANAEMKQSHYVAALNILEGIPEARLSQDDSVELMLAKSRLYRQIDLPSTAISMLRRRVPFVAESRLRAQLSLELAECYVHNDELTPARNELNEAIGALPAGRDSQRAAFLLARIAWLNGNKKQAEAICLDVLNLNIQVETLRREVYDLLGEIYTQEKAFDRAALAYAGLLEQSNRP
ncbi:MAG: tetratricopeptide repeat protein [Phycisphaerae bacterium]|nr:tetratricopeptide repeat protein [Phycisphaerae bacterium]